MNSCMIEHPLGCKAEWSDAGDSIEVLAQDLSDDMYWHHWYRIRNGAHVETAGGTLMIDGQPISYTPHPNWKWMLRAAW